MLEGAGAGDAVGDGSDALTAGGSDVLVGLGVGVSVGVTVDVLVFVGSGTRVSVGVGVNVLVGASSTMFVGTGSVATVGTVVCCISDSPSHATMIPNEAIATKVVAKANMRPWDVACLDVCEDDISV